MPAPVPVLRDLEDRHNTPFSSTFAAADGRAGLAHGTRRRHRHHDRLCARDPHPANRQRPAGAGGDRGSSGGWP